MLGRGLGVQPTAHTRATYLDGSMSTHKTHTHTHTHTLTFVVESLNCKLGFSLNYEHRLKQSCDIHTD